MHFGSLVLGEDLKTFLPHMVITSIFVMLPASWSQIFVHTKFGLKRSSGFQGKQVLIAHVNDLGWDYFHLTWSEQYHVV